MGAKRKIVVELLPIMVAAFPQTFFTHPHQVRPLKVDIYQELVANLPAGMSLELLKRFMYWYTHRPAYQRALSEGRQRVDLTGADAGEVGDAIRQQARARYEARRQGLPLSVAEAAPPVAAKPAPTTAAAVAPAAAPPVAATVAPSLATPPTADPADPGASGWRPKLSLKNQANAG